MPHAAAPRLLSRNDVDLLTVFYLGLTFDERRARFGGGISDHAVRHYCRSIAWDDVVVAAIAGRLLLRAVIEIHPLGPFGVGAEIVMPSSGHAVSQEAVAEMARVALAAAGDCGWRRFQVYDGRHVLSALVPLAAANGERPWLIAEIADREICQHCCC